jgi:hypothetical protein
MLSVDTGPVAWSPDAAGQPVTRASEFLAGADNASELETIGIGQGLAPSPLTCLCRSEACPRQDSNLRHGPVTGGYVARISVPSGACT